MLIPSWEGVTTYNTPNALKINNREEFMTAIGDGNKHFCDVTFPKMQTQEREFKRKLDKTYED